MLFSSFKNKIIFLVTILSITINMAIYFYSVFQYKQTTFDTFGYYVQDLTAQIENNLEWKLSDIENTTLQLLANNAIQQDLEQVNGGKLEPIQEWTVKHDMLAAINPLALYNPSIRSLSIVSDTGEEFTVQKIEKEPIDIPFDKQTIYDAKGSSLWTLYGPDHEIVVARAINSLKTMRPLGYINMVCENVHFSSLLEDTSRQYSTGMHVVDGNGVIVSSNDPDAIGSMFPLDLGKLSNLDFLEKDVVDGIPVYIFKGETLQNGWSVVTAIRQDELTRYISDYRNKILAVCLVVLAIILALEISILDNLASPINTIVKSIKRFGEGDLGTRIECTSDNEFGKIADEFNAMADSIHDLLDRIVKMERAQQEAELAFLRMSISPHFLYNTLDTISWMGNSCGNRDISKMAIALANLLRSSVKGERIVSLREEQQIVQNYLYIQEFRFSDKIEVSYDIDPETLDCQVPKLLLQPLIENSIVHGLEPKVEKGHLSIRCRLLGDNLQICIADDGVGLAMDEIASIMDHCRRNDKKQHLGIVNVYQRLVLNYGDSFGFSMEKNDEGGLTTTIVLEATYERPIEKGVDDEKRGTV
jgi:two-component system sensor histidine kinase YesM